MTSSNPQRVFVKADDTATISCPVCQIARTIDVSKFRATKHSMTARCTCGHTFPVSLDFRKHYRKKTEIPGIYETQPLRNGNKAWKETKLTGSYTMQAPATGSGHIVITNLSCGGLQFTLPSRHSIEVGQVARINFTLDDRNQTEITKRVVIQSVNNNVVGCQFTGNEPLEQGLRFYLFP